MPGTLRVESIRSVERQKRATTTHLYTQVTMSTKGDILVSNVWNARPNSLGIEPEINGFRDRIKQMRSCFSIVRGSLCLRMLHRMLSKHFN